MSTIRCHFDGKVIIPDEPVDLPVDQPIYIRIEDTKGRPGVVFIDPPDGKPMTVGEMLASGAVRAGRNEATLEIRRRLQSSCGERLNGAGRIGDSSRQ